MVCKRSVIFSQTTRSSSITRTRGSRKSALYGDFIGNVLSCFHPARCRASGEMASRQKPAFEKDGKESGVANPPRTPRSRRRPTPRQEPAEEPPVPLQRQGR